jgi:hypothetical protein
LYAKTKVGKLDGILRVEWIGENNFVYVPDEKSPLTFVSSDGRHIVPKKMYTDGGSIPPVFWGFPGLSPWGYAPGYMVHDWLFEMHRCQYPGYEEISFGDSARILSEAIKTLMEGKKIARNEDAFFAISEAVSSRLAQDRWANGKCTPVPPVPEGLPTQRVIVLTLDFTAH